MNNQIVCDQGFVWLVIMLSYITAYWLSTTCDCNRIIDYDCSSKWAVFILEMQSRLWALKIGSMGLVSHHVSSFYFSACRFDFLLWCLCGACHTPTPQQRRLLLASSSVSSVSKFSRAATLPVPVLTPARSPAQLTWWRWPSQRPSRLTCQAATAPTAASTAGHTWPTTTSSSQRYSSFSPCPSFKPPCSISHDIQQICLYL